MKSLCRLVMLPAGLGDEGGRAARGCVPRPRCTAGVWVMGDAQRCKGESCKKPQNPNHGCFVSLAPQHPGTPAPHADQLGMEEPAHPSNDTAVSPALREISPRFGRVQVWVKA